jgi:hypothetical protein
MSTPLSPLILKLIAVQGHIRYLISVRRFRNAYNIAQAFTNAYTVWKDTVSDHERDSDQHWSTY